MRFFLCLQFTVKDKVTIISFWTTGVWRWIEFSNEEPIYKVMKSNFTIILVNPVCLVFGKKTPLDRSEVRTIELFRLNISLDTFLKVKRSRRMCSLSVHADLLELFSRNSKPWHNDLNRQEFMCYIYSKNYISQF